MNVISSHDFQPFFLCCRFEKVSRVRLRDLEDVCTYLRPQAVIRTMNHRRNVIGFLDRFQFELFNLSRYSLSVVHDREEVESIP